MAYKGPKWCSHDGHDGGTCDACELAKGYIGCTRSANAKRGKEGNPWYDGLRKICGGHKDETAEAALLDKLSPEEREKREKVFTNQDATATTEAPPPQPLDQKAALVFLQTQIEELQKKVSTMENQIALHTCFISHLEVRSGIARKAQEQQHGFSKKIYSYLSFKGWLGPDYQEYTGEDSF